MIVDFYYGICDRSNSPKSPIVIPKGIDPESILGACRPAQGGIFEEVTRLRSAVVECYEVTGTSDYVVKIVVHDMNAYHNFLHNVLVKIHGVSQVNTSISLCEVKYETALPLV